MKKNLVTFITVIKDIKDDIKVCKENLRKEYEVDGGIIGLNYWSMLLTTIVYFTITLRFRMPQHLAKCSIISTKLTC